MPAYYVVGLYDYNNYILCLLEHFERGILISTQCSTGGPIDERMLRAAANVEYDEAEDQFSAKHGSWARYPKIKLISGRYGEEYEIKNNRKVVLFKLREEDEYKYFCSDVFGICSILAESEAVEIGLKKGFANAKVKKAGKNNIFSSEYSIEGIDHAIPELDSTTSRELSIAFLSNEEEYQKLCAKSKLLGANMKIYSCSEDNCVLFGINRMVDEEIDSLIVYPFISIGKWAFWERRIENLRLCNGTKVIMDTAFLSSRIDKLFIPDSVVYIGDTAFANARIREVHIGAQVRSLVPFMILRNPLKTIEISPDNLYIYMEDDKIFERESNEILMEHQGDKWVFV